ncbi:MAG: hypothetical protein ACLFVK_05870 [Dehalococcoidia bacterium]
MRNEVDNHRSVRVIRWIARILGILYGILWMLSLQFIGLSWPYILLGLLTFTIVGIAWKWSERWGELVAGGMFVIFGIGLFIYDSAIKPPLGSGDLFWICPSILIGILFLIPYVARRGAFSMG